ncbi:MAG: aminoglycoside phosphotransferase family protein [Pirellulaceae bacterium]|nr:aminoglycoside phosphotransferase family protein [Pirellulaceae bacterium]
MFSHSILERERSLVGLEVLLDPELTARAIQDCGVPLDGGLQTEYLRYKPGRRCISLVRAKVAGTEQRFVLSAFPPSHFAKQLAKTSDAQTQGKCWQTIAHRLRIDRFPYDPGLRHIQKCFDERERSRLLRRVMGRDARLDQISLETLAYKPGRRFVTSVRLENDSTSSTQAEPLYTLKFYAGSLFKHTLRRLQSMQSVDIESPKVVASHEHYQVIAFDWIHGRLLADIVESDQVDDSLLMEVGHQLARVHNCRPTTPANPSASAHDLSDLAEYIGFLCPDLAVLAEKTVRVTQVRLADSQQQSTFIHGDFYAKQVLVDGSAVKFIDFDQAGLGNPYQDVGNFVAKLYWQSIRLGKSVSHLSAQADAFLLGYRGHFRGFDEQDYRVHLAAGLIRCATHPFRRAMQNWPDATRQLLMLAQHALHPASAWHEPGNMLEHA